MFVKIIFSFKPGKKPTLCGEESYVGDVGEESKILFIYLFVYIF